MIKKTIINIKELLKKAIKSFPVTNLCVFIITIITILNIDINFSYELLEKCYLFFGTLGIGSYFIETKKANKIFYVIPIVISTFFIIMSEINLSTELSEFIYKVLITYILSASIYSLYNNYKNSQKEFEGYLEDIFKGVIKLSLVYGILALSILIIGLIFDFLIIDISEFDIISKIEIFILGVYYIPNILYALKGEDNSESLVIKGLIRKVLTPLAYISFIIIYMFLFKIIINGDKPESEVFYIMSFLFSVDVPILLMASSYKENKLIDKINKYSSFIFIPFIIVQIYALVNEVYYRGIEVECYIWIMIIIFEILYLIHSILKKDYGNLFIIAIVMTIVGIVVPFINAEDLSFYSQYNNLKLYNQNEEYTEIQKIRIYNAYKYIKNSKLEEKYFKKLNISEEDIEVIKSFNENNEAEDYNENVYESIMANYNGVIDINGYTELYEVRITNNNKADYINQITINYGNKHTKFNFYNQYMKYYENKENIEDYFKMNNEIVLDKTHKLILTNLNIRYVNDEITRYWMEGYLLVK